MKVVFASHNQGKVNEVVKLLQMPNLEVLSLDEAGLSDFEVEETGETFADNALLKAQAVGEKTQLPAIADDSGLVVNALGGRPGVYSARLISGSDADRCQEVLRLMTDQLDRTAKFVTSVCWYNPETPEQEFFEGEVSGRIAAAAAGSSGFGYDPIFIPDGYTETFAQLGLEVKNQLSHRARAIAKLKVFLNDR